MRRHDKVTGPLATDRTDRLSRSIAPLHFSCPRVRIRPHSNITREIWKVLPAEAEVEKDQSPIATKSDPSN